MVLHNWRILAVVSLFYYYCSFYCYHSVVRNRSQMLFIFHLSHRVLLNPVAFNNRKFSFLAHRLLLDARKCGCNALKLAKISLCLQNRIMIRYSSVQFDLTRSACPAPCVFVVVYWSAHFSIFLFRFLFINAILFKALNQLKY